MAMTYKFSIFDYNGVLIDDEAVHLEAFRAALDPLGVSVRDVDYWERYIGFDDREGFAHMLLDAGRSADPALVDELVQAKVPLYLERAKLALKGFAGAVELVTRQAQRGPVLVVSGALSEEIELGLDWLGIRRHVDHVIAAEDTEASKPDPEGYLLALSWLERQGHSAPQAESVVFEDSLAGIAAAKAAGLSCVAIGHSYPLDKLHSSPADWVVPAIGDIDEATLATLYARCKR